MTTRPPNTEQQVYRLELRADRSVVPALIRLKRLLKAAKRAYGFSCLSAVQVNDLPAAGSIPAEGTEVQP